MYVSSDYAKVVVSA